MKLYHISLTGYYLDVTTDYIVYANSEKEARLLVAEEETNFVWKDKWMYETESSCNEIIQPDEPKIVVEFFTPA